MFKDLVIEGVSKKVALKVLKLLLESIEKGSSVPDKISDEAIIDESYPEGYNSGRRILKIYYYRRA